VQTGDYVSLDLNATVGGEEVEGGSTTGLTYEVGSGELVPGIDEALVGMVAGEEKTFQTELVAGDYADRTADVAVTVRSVKQKELPELDDDFAQTASEFDTLDELREDVRGRLGRVRRMEQGVAARDRVFDALLAQVDVPLPQSVVQQEIDYRRHTIEHQLSTAGLTMDAYLATEGRSQEDMDTELREASEQAVRGQLVLDALADTEQVGVSDTELTEEVVRRAQQAGASPDQYASQLMQAGQLPLLVADVRRGKALAHVLETAKITDASGNEVDLEALQRETRSAAAEAMAGAEASAQAEVEAEVEAAPEEKVEAAAEEPENA
jgi:trigger factor